VIVGTKELATEWQLGTEDLVAELVTGTKELYRIYWGN
jgi:hypothetical protein